MGASEVGYIISSKILRGLCRAAIWRVLFCPHFKSQGRRAAQLAYLLLDQPSESAFVCLNRATFFFIAALFDDNARRITPGPHSYS